MFSPLKLTEHLKIGLSFLSVNRTIGEDKNIYFRGPTKFALLNSVASAFPVACRGELRYEEILSAETYRRQHHIDVDIACRGLSPLAEYVLSRLSLLHASDKNSKFLASNFTRSFFGVSMPLCCHFFKTIYVPPAKK